MEFFQWLDAPKLDVLFLKDLLNISNLTELCRSITAVTRQNGNEGEIYSVWGAFDVRRDELKQGVRFSLLNCPHAFAWTITYDADKRNLIIHCTIDKTEHDQDFIDSIHDFTLEWATGIRKALQLPGQPKL